METEVERLTGQMQLVVARQQVQLERCYQRAAKVASMTEPLEGKISVRFTLMSDGTAQMLEVAKNSTGSSVLADCVVGLVAGWRFPDGERDELEFEWPFSFKPKS